MDHEPCRLILRTLLDAAEGRIGHFVPAADVIAASSLDDDRARAALAAALSRRWCYMRRGSVAASRWGLEFAMDWTHVPRLLRAILNSSGEIGEAADYAVVVAASGLSWQRVRILIEELDAFGLTSDSYSGAGADTSGPYVMPGPCVTERGWEYLRNGGPDGFHASEGGLLDQR